MADQTTSQPGFAHLHLHSHFSLLDGANRLDRLIRRIADLGMDAVALTDHGNLFGAVEFYTRCKDANIKPILGIEAYVAPGDRTRREVTGLPDGGFHLVLLAENNIGWQHLLKLSSDAYVNGFYYRPRMDRSTLEQWSQGLIAINGHLGSSIAHHLLNYHRSGDEQHYQRAVAEARWHADTFKPNEQGQPCFFIELQRHDEADQEAINPHLVKLARELDLPLICDNDAHFLTEEDHDPHDALICISTGKTKDETNRLRYSPQLYVKSAQQMQALFADYLEGAGDEAMANTSAVARRCNVDMDFSANHAPMVRIVYRPVDPKNGDASDTAALPDAAAGASEFVRQFECEHPVGSSDWYQAFCARFELEPFDSQEDSTGADELKRQCDAALRVLTEAGAVWRYGADGITEEIRARMERELQVLADKLISAYFLIVWDFVNYARSQGIPSNARGSGVGTMVGYCLGLSNACPVKYGLLFERFTDPDRTEYPDIDIDICQDGRAEVIDYVRRKYGHVAQIITFGTLKARAAIRDVGRVMNIPLSEVDRIAKLVPGDLGMTLDRALEAEPDLKTEYDQNPQTRALVDTARRLEGMARHASVHAAGVVLATQPLDNIVPLYRQAGGDELITQWDGPTCEKVGLLKMDFLGLRTLSIIQRCRELVEATMTPIDQLKTILGYFGRGPVPDSPREFGLQGDQPDLEALLKRIDPLDLDRLTYRDQNVLDLFRRGDTAGVFQFESGGMRNLLMAMAPDRFEDLIAANALYRPGPMDLIPDYNDRKHARAQVPKVHPIVDQFTDDTYGVMAYQEQVMQIVHNLGGIPLRAAYTLIKAISKKKQKVIEANRPKFIEGAVEKGLSASDAAGLFELILKFAGYGFNKSHSTGYAIVAYQTAFLKTYFPVHYMAALLTYESVSTEKVVQYIEDCRRVRLPDGRVGIDVKPPDINRSFRDFSVVYEDGQPHDPNHPHIRFGLSAVRGVGGKAVDQIIKERKANGPFTSLFNFCERVPQGVANRSLIEAIIKCGAFDSLHGVQARAALVAAIDQAISRGAQEAELRSSDDFLFGALAGGEADGAQPATEPEPALPSVPAWDMQTTLAEEQAVLGFFVSSHPLDDHRRTIQRFGNVAIRRIRNLKADVEVIVGGMFSRVRPTLVKNGRSAGQKMAMITIEDRGGSIEGVIFSDAYARYMHLIEKNRLVFVRGSVDRRREEPSIRIDAVYPMEEAATHLTRAMKVTIRDRDADGQPRQYNGELSSLRNALRHHAGPARVYLEVHDGDRVVLLESKFSVAPTPLLVQQIQSLINTPDCCELVGPVKLAKQGAAVMLADGEPVVVDRLAASDEDDPVCESIDRY